MEKLFKILKDLINRQYWGIVEIKFEKGVCVHIKLIENIKP